jgi:tetratricopeptide (TPR) repeat protein
MNATRKKRLSRRPLRRGCCCGCREPARASPKESRFSVVLGNITKAAVPILLLWSLLVIGMNMKARTLVEPVSVSSELAATGLSEAAAQRTLITHLQQVISDARETMPGDIKDEVEADEPEPVVDVPGTGISLQSIIQYTKQSLHFGDVSIRSTLLKSGTLYKAHVYVTDASSDVDDETTPPQSASDALGAAALSVMSKHNKFIYASALATRSRTDCYEHNKCDYADAIQAFNDVLKDDGYVRYHKWSWLALSKISEDQRDYAKEVSEALLAVRSDRRLFWAYYNWGIGLGEQGCDKQALDAFQRALRYRPMSDFVNNAAGRQALILALEADGIDEKQRKYYLDLASGFLMRATQLNPDYAEAYVNLGKVLMQIVKRPDPPDAVPTRVKALLQNDDRQDLVETFDAVLLTDSAQIQRANHFADEANATLGNGLHPDQSQFGMLISELKRVHSPSPACAAVTLASTTLESKGCLSSQEQQFDSVAGAQLVAARKAMAKPIHGKLDCESQSLRANIGQAEPILYAPVY